MPACSSTALGVNGRQVRATNIEMENRLEKLALAERALKLVLAIRTHALMAKTNEGLRRLTAPDPRRALAEERETGIKLDLTREEEEQASGELEHAATYLVAQQIDAVMAETFKNRFEHADPDIRTAACIVSILCDSLADNHFVGTWKIPAKWNWREFKIDDVISLDTQKIADKPVRRRDYGGPLALLKLIAFVRTSLGAGAS